MYTDRTYLAYKSNWFMWYHIIMIILWSFNWQWSETINSQSTADWLTSLMQKSLNRKHVHMKPCHHDWHSRTSDKSAKSSAVAFIVCTYTQQCLHTFLLTKLLAMLSGRIKFILLWLIIHGMVSSVTSSHFRGGIFMIRPNPGGTHREVTLIS